MLKDADSKAQCQNLVSAYLTGSYLELFCGVYK